MVHADKPCSAQPQPSSSEAHQTPDTAATHTSHPLNVHSTCCFTAVPQQCPYPQHAANKKAQKAEHSYKLSRMASEAMQTAAWWSSTTTTATATATPAVRSALEQQRTSHALAGAGGMIPEAQRQALKPFHPGHALVPQSPPPWVQCSRDPNSQEAHACLVLFSRTDITNQ